jgi:site-specific DNA-methyltransferase (adenine-specific)
MVTNIENAGFYIQGQINWIYASGMPKSTNLSLKIDKHLGHPNRGREVATASRNQPNGKKLPNGVKLPPYEAITEEAKNWSGYGTAGLKPAYEPIAIAQKPISEKNIAANVLKWGTGGINVDACRIDERFPADIILECICDNMSVEESMIRKTNHIIVKHTDPDCPCFQMDAQSGLTDQGYRQNSKLSGKAKIENGQSINAESGHKYKISAGASSYFRVIYNSKASKLEKERGLAKNGQSKDKQNQHPTVKPIALMKELIQLFIPEGGKFIDPYIGSGTSGVACLALGNRNFIGVELDKMYYDTAVNRCNYEVVLKNQN